MKPSELRNPKLDGSNRSHQTSATSGPSDKPNSKDAQELFNYRTNFEYTKKVAIARLEKTINDQLNILTLRDDQDYANMEKLSKFMFTWSGKDFFKRRALKNCVWIDVLTVQAKEHCLERFKLQTDLKEIKIFLKSIFQAFENLQDNFDLVEALVYKPLRETERNLSILETLYNEKENLKEILRDQKLLINTRFLEKRTTMAQHMLFGIEERVINEQNCHPIKTRFEINWYQCKTEQAQYRSDLEEKLIQNRIDDYKLKIYSEQMSGDTIRDTYYALAEQYKTDMGVLQNSFSIKLDAIDSKISYKRLEISKLVEQRNLLSKEIDRFHEEIKNRLVKEEKRKRREEELARLKSVRLKET